MMKEFLCQLQQKKGIYDGDVETLLRFDLDSVKIFRSMDAVKKQQQYDHTTDSLGHEHSKEWFRGKRSPYELLSRIDKFNMLITFLCIIPSWEFNVHPALTFVTMASYLAKICGGTNATKTTSILYTGGNIKSLFPYCG